MLPSPPPPLLRFSVLFLIVTMVYLTEQERESPSVVEVRNRTLYVNGEEYFVRGVNYNPIPRGEDGTVWPFGEYFGAPYASTLFDWKTFTWLYTTSSIWEVPPPTSAWHFTPLPRRPVHPPRPVPRPPPPPATQCVS